MTNRLSLVVMIFQRQHFAYSVLPTEPDATTQLNTSLGLSWVASGSVGRTEYAKMLPRKNLDNEAKTFCHVGVRTFVSAAATECGSRVRLLWPREVNARPSLFWYLFVERLVCALIDDVNEQLANLADLRSDCLSTFVPNAVKRAIGIQGEGEWY